VAAVEAHFGPVFGHLQAVSVQLQFVHPPVASGHAVGRYRLQGWMKCGNMNPGRTRPRRFLQIIRTMPDHLVASQQCPNATHTHRGPQTGLA
jgi:hypothetical protein